MWHYLWAHAVFHLTRWLPPNNRLKIRIVLCIFTFALLIPQVFVLALPHTERYCSEPLFEMLIVSVVFTFCMIGFSILFSLMEPVPWEVKLAFHIFGIVCFLIGGLITIFTSKAQECSNSTAELFWFSVCATIVSMISMIFFAVLTPFWIVNRVWKNSVLDRRNRDGICYEPVTCCSCMWHI